jgi:hypothetical protein
MNVIKSNRKDKRFVAVFDSGERVHFGKRGGKTYIDSRSKNERDNYLARHEENPLEKRFLKNKKQFYNTPSVLSAEILWGSKKNINKNISTFKKKYL